MKKSGNKMAGDLYAGLSRNNPAGDSGFRPVKASVNDGPTRTGPATSHNLSGRQT